MNATYFIAFQFLFVYVIIIRIKADKYAMVQGLQGSISHGHRSIKMTQG